MFNPIKNNKNLIYFVGEETGGEAEYGPDELGDFPTSPETTECTDELHERFQEMHEDMGPNILDHVSVFKKAEWIGPELINIASAHPEQMIFCLYEIMEEPYLSDVVRAMAGAIDYTKLILDDLDNPHVMIHADYSKDPH
ncbi:hypothetical protein KJ742_01855, partial [Patescibacteria group bacterium]|nr:hypothetical protein [Patescibacteria group bacterium]